jgi:AcrR family transcriptional regulator
VSSPSARPRRADAQRNHDAVLAAARAVFAQAGTDAPMEEVARAAGVGKGTLYRRFPTREHLFAAILQERVDELDASARRALGAPDVWRALSEWLELYDQCATEYPGMSARVGESLSDDTSAVGTLCGPMKNSFARLFERATQEVPLRRDLTATQLLSMVSALPKDAGTGRTPEPYLRLVLDGLRAPSAPGPPHSPAARRRTVRGAAGAGAG